MDLERYRRAMLSIEEPPKLEEETIKQVLEAGQVYVRERVGERGQGAAAAYSKPKASARRIARVCTGLAACILLIACLVGVVDANARATSVGQENMELSVLSAGYVGGIYTLDLNARLNTPQLQKATGDVTVALDDLSCLFLDADADLAGSESLNFGEPCQITPGEGNIDLVLRLSIDPDCVDVSRLAGERIEDLPFRSREIMRIAIEVLSESKLIVEDQEEGGQWIYRFEVERAEEQIGYESRLRSGGPLLVSLERVNNEYGA
ncbi:hypothetical protein [uncultured Adlercreutzia sp.]|uniref:hypothetical protein n=1 Tax=uncultured Adlercreutzia sp. TaxID=875803 RepID=UPI0026F3D967|nr:hypothetical protein [uncultured Adlercreutzia sp.]